MYTKSIYKLTLLLGIFSISSCQKEFTPTNLRDASFKAPSFGNVSINGSSGMIDEDTLSKTGFQKTAASTGSLLLSARGNKIGAVHIEKNEFWTDTSEPGTTIEGYADEFLMTPDWLGRLDVFHLGSLIKGNTLQDLSFVPLSEREGHYSRKPIYASVSFPADTVSGSFAPDVMATSEFFSKLMLQNGLSTAQKSSFKYEIKEFNYFSEIKTVFGSNVDIKALFYKSGSTSATVSDQISKASGLVASFTQENFTVDMDLPEPGELYENLNMGLLNDVLPGYISSIKYGSKGVLLIESEETADVLKKTFNKAFSVMGGLVSGTQTMTADEDKVIRDAQIQIFFTGADGKSIVKQLGSFDELIGFIKTGTSFSPTTPGVPIAFKMRTAKTNNTIISNFSIRIPFKPFYIKQEFIVDPNIQSAPRHELHLSFFADKDARIPINVPNRTPIYADTKFLRIEREGSPREGFTLQHVYGPEVHYNLNQGNKMIIKPVLLINGLSSSPTGLYRDVAERVYIYKPPTADTPSVPTRPDRSPRGS